MPFDCALMPDDASLVLTLDERLENWASVWRYRLRLDQAQSMEGAYRSPQRSHWHDTLGTAPSAPTQQNALDAQEVELAICALDIYHHVLLKGWYVRRWSEPKCLQIARREAGDERTRRRGNFDASLLMARALLGAQLAVPAVVRRTRAVERVRLALGFPAGGLGHGG